MKKRKLKIAPKIQEQVFRIFINSNRSYIHIFIVRSKENSNGNIQ